MATAALPAPLQPRRRELIFGTAFATAGVELWLPSGHLRCNVSREHINVLSRNTIKSMREPIYYREFVGVLVANGARAV